jgi:hypothetical protein
LDNLVSNAIKYTDRGSVTIQAQVSEILGKPTLTLSVKDTGKGMTDEEKQKVFQAFTRLKSAQGIEGTGLGLSITQELVSLLGGEIILHSTLGKGSTFIVTIPIEPAPKEESQEMAPSEMKHDPSPDSAQDKEGQNSGSHQVTDIKKKPEKFNKKRGRRNLILKTELRVFIENYYQEIMSKKIIKRIYNVVIILLFLGCILWSAWMLEFIFFFTYGEHYNWLDSKIMQMDVLLFIFTGYFCIQRMLHIRHPYIEPAAWMHIRGTESVHMMRKLQAATTSAAFSRSWRLVKWNFILKRKGNGIATPTTLNMMIMSTSSLIKLYSPITWLMAPP